MSVNDSGTVVGYFSTSDGDDSQAFMSTAPESGELINLNTEVATLVPPGWTLTSAYCINNNGRITGGMKDQPTADPGVYVWDSRNPDGFWPLYGHDVAAVDGLGEEYGVESLWVSDMSPMFKTKLTGESSWVTTGSQAGARNIGAGSC